MKKINKIVQKSLVILIILSLSSFSISAISIFSEKKDNETSMVNSSSVMSLPIYSPEWNIGDFWTYDMDFYFEAVDKFGITNILVNGKISEMKAMVQGYDELNGKNVYVLSCSGYFSGNVFYLGLFDIGNLNNALFTGTAYLTTDMLAPKIFDFEIDGKVSIFLLGKADFNFDLDMSFSPEFNFLNFPMFPDEDEWTVSIDKAILDAHVSIKDALFGLIDVEKDYYGSRIFNEYMITKGITNVDVEAGDFECALLSGSVGDVSNLYYSPEVGFLTMIEESLEWGSKGHIDTRFFMELIDYNKGDVNNPPEKPSNPSPEHRETNQDIDVDLSWTGKDPDDDTVYYDVYFGKNTNQLNCVSQKQTITTFNPGILEYEEKYYWKIVAFDNRGEKTNGDIWWFTTCKEQYDNNPPYEPSCVFPPDRKTNVFIATPLIWAGGDPDPDDTVKYDVYLGTKKPLSDTDLISEEQKQTTCYSDLLNPGIKYYWKIVAFDDQGEATEGDTWEFTTLENLPDETDNSPPSKPSITGPSKINTGKTYTWTFKSTDPDGDKIAYIIIAGSKGFYRGAESGKEVEIKLKFDVPVNFLIKAVATDNPNPDSGDEGDHTSDWSYLQVTCPKNKHFILRPLSLFNNLKFTHFVSLSNIL